MSLTTGTILSNRYRIGRLLGQGGFGAVYRAWDLNLERPCAVKENLDTSPESRAQFKREAKMLADLTHPNLPNVIDHFFIQNQGQYLVMDYVEGDDLQQMLDTVGGKPLPEDQVLAWMDQVCDALVYLHGQQSPIIHRDIKPANIRITPKGKAMLVDFGIAKQLTPGLKTLTGARAYTPGYASPEQQGGKGTDILSDVYSLGATTYTLLTGLVPPSATDIISGLELPPAPVEQINPKIFARVGQAVNGAMQLNRDRRTPTISEFRAALGSDSAKLDPTIGALSKDPTVPIQAQSSTVPVSSPRRPAWLPWVGAGAVVVAIIIIAYILGALGGGNGDPEGTESALADYASQTLAVRNTQTTEARTAVAIVPQETSTPVDTDSPTSTITNTAIPTETSQPTSTPTPTQIPGMVLVPAGPFKMGSESGESGESPVHEVYLDDFYIDVYEVTNNHYIECVISGGCNPPSSNESYTHSNYYGNPEYANYPVIHVNWYDAEAYCKWRGARLPTEAEWEKAARGGLEGMKFPWGDESPDCRAGAEFGAKFDNDAGCNDTDTEAVGSYSPNGYGLYDMAGNVLEWVSSLYQGYPYEEDEGREDPYASGKRVLRGGSWSLGPAFLRVADRNSEDPNVMNNLLGFRCARSP